MTKITRHETLWIIKFTIKHQSSNKTTKIFNLGKIKRILVSKDQNILSFDSSNHERTQRCCHVKMPKAQQKLDNITNLSLNSSDQKVFGDIFILKMLMKEDSGGGNNKVALSVSPLDKWTPPIPSLSILGKLEEMIACTSAVYIIGAIIAVKSCTVLSSSFSRGGVCFPEV